LSSIVRTPTLESGVENIATTGVTDTVEQSTMPSTTPSAEETTTGNSDTTTGGGTTEQAWSQTYDPSTRPTSNIRTDTGIYCALSSIEICNTKSLYILLKK